MDISMRRCPGFSSSFNRYVRGDNRALFSSLKTIRSPAAVVTRLYSGWSYVSIRLNAEVVEYEESGAMFFRSVFMDRRDRLLRSVLCRGGSECLRIRQ